LSSFFERFFILTDPEGLGKKTSENRPDGSTT
jgi:hypothetical protein